MSNPPFENSNTSRIRIVIADDHIVVRDGLAGILSAQSDIDIVAEAGDGDEAMSAYEEHHPNMMILDLKMPVRDGFGVLAALQERNIKANILVVSTYDGDQDVFRALKLGAKGYLLKDSPRGVIVDAVRKVAAGERFTPGDIASKLLDHMASPEITGRELEVLAMLSEGRSNKDIARRLGITEGTVKSHVRGLMFKLNAASRTEVVSTALRRGYVKVA